MANEQKPAQEPEMNIPGGPAAVGRENFDKAVLDAQGGPADRRGDVLNPTSPNQMGNPFGAEVIAGSARLSNKELLARSKGAQGVSQDGGSGVQGAGSPGQGQGDQKTLQAENDRLKSMMKRLEADALLGRTVKSDPLLYQKVTDSMSGTSGMPSQYPIQAPNGQVVAIPAQGQLAPGQQPAKTLKEQLGLPFDWVPIFEDMETPGTDTYRWNQAKIRLEARAMIDEDNRQREVINELNTERQSFIGAGHSEDDLAQLLLFMSDKGNFSLNKIWSYMHLAEMIANGTDRGNAQGKPEYNPSVTAQPGGGVIADGVLPEVELGNGLLQMAEANRNPLI